MKKSYSGLTLGILAVLVFIPQVAFAVWWNPITWFNHWQFLKNNNETEKLESRIQELEAQLAEKDQVSESNNEASEMAPKVYLPTQVQKNITVQPESTSTKTELRTESGAIMPEPETTPDELVANENTADEPFTFKVVRVAETIFKETEDYYAYGGFQIEVEITANQGDVYIPETTSDSTKGQTGFSYSVIGDEFRGQQNSKVDCSRRNSGYCRIVEGNSSIITVTIWLSPTLPGNYGVLFENMKAKVGSNGNLQTYSISKETEKVYIPH